MHTPEIVWPDLTDWPQTAAEAIALQQTLRQQIRLTDDIPSLSTIAGVDVGYDNESERSHASIILLRHGTMEILAATQAFMPTTFPYVPGLLSFREIPVIIEAMKQLPQMPDLLMVDGHGIAHPRRMGIAAHLGVLLDLPSIGVAKSLLTGRYGDLGPSKGSIQPLTDRQTGQQIGTVLRSKEGCNPLYISPGHRVSMINALRIAQAYITKYRLPEPTRLADKLSKVPKPDNDKA